MIGKIWGKILRPSQKFVCCYTDDERAPPNLLLHFWKDSGGNTSPCLHSPASLCILFYTRSLYSLLQATVCHCNEHRLSPVSKDRAVDICKIASNALKPGMWKRWKRSFFCGSGSAKILPLPLPHRLFDLESNLAKKFCPFLNVDLSGEVAL